MTRTYELTSPVYPAIEAAAIEAFASSGSFSQGALSGPIADALGKDPHRVAQALPQALRALQRRAMYVPQRARKGAKDDGPRGLTSPYAFNFSNRPLGDATLRHAVAPFLQDEEVPATAKRALRSALRFVLQLSTQCPDDVLLSAADRVPAHAFYDLPNRIYDTALRPPSSLDEQTARNYRTALRRLLRYAGSHRLVPMIFPRLWVSNAWEEAKDRYFPLATEGRTANNICAFRTAWSALAEAAVETLGEAGRDPANLTRSTAEQCLAHLRQGLAREAMAYKARWALRHVADSHGVGPFAGDDPASEFEVVTPAGRRAALYLRGLQGEGASGDWEAFLALVRANGFPDEIVEFLAWYRDYVTLNAREIRRQRQRFPARREGLHISGRTLNERILALRALMGAAVYALEVPSRGRNFGLRYAPAELTPTELFGHRFQAILTAMETWWDARSGVLPAGSLGKSVTGALRQMIIGCGMVSLALYEHLRHRRRLTAAIRVTETGNMRLDSLEEEGAPKNADETAAWEAYRDANALADALTGETQPGKKGRRARRKNDFRNIQEIILTTPPKYWIDLQEAQLAQLRATPVVDRGRYEYHALVLNALLLGLLISTGCRIEELCHIRLDVQFTVEDLDHRRIRLRAQDRKNTKAHTVLVQPAFVPDDLLDTYLRQTRPWLMARYCRQSSARAEHPFLLASTSGQPYGCMEETEDGTNRDESKFQRRSNQAGRRFTAQMARLARELKQKVPGKYMAGPHTVRAACGYGVFLLRGLQAAAHYLGDTENTTRDSYSNINGEHVNSTCLVGFLVQPQLSSATEWPGQNASSGAAGHRVRELEIEVAELRAALEEARRPLAPGGLAA